MNGKVLLRFLVLCLFVGIVSADTLIAVASNDGNIGEDSNGVFPQLRNNVGDLIGNNPANYCGAYATAYTTQDIFTNNYRCGETIPTDALPDSAVLLGAVYSVYGATKYDTAYKLSLELIDFTPENSGVFIEGDYDSTNFIVLSENITYDQFLVGSYNNFTLNSEGLSRISKTGNTTLMLDHSASVYNYNLSSNWENGAIFGYRLRSVAYSGGTAKPFLTIEYTLSDTTPPASITNLANDTYECDLVNWSWTNPEDADFDLVQVYQNGTFLHNVTTAYDNWTALEELTEYEIGTHTCDATGNCNSTFVNASFTTISCSAAVIPVASFISNATCGNVPFAVQFNDTSLNVPTSWNWSFGNGVNFSEEQNPVFTYTDAGLFTINFNATNEAGTGWSNVTNYIRAVPDWASCPLVITPTPWQPEIMPSTETDFNLQRFIASWWWVAALVIVAWLLFRRR